MTWEEVAILDNAQSAYRKYRAEIEEYQEIVAQLEHQIATLQRQLAAARKEATKAVAHSKGLSAQICAITEALKENGKTVPLQASSGFVWPAGCQFAGKPMSVAGAIYLREVHAQLKVDGVTPGNFAQFYV